MNLRIYCLFFSCIVLAGIGCTKALSPAAPQPAAPQSNPGISAADSGGADAGGGDSAPPWAGTAWFQDHSRTIKACYVVAKDFSVPTAGIPKAIESAFAIWKKYILGHVNLLYGVGAPAQALALDMEFVVCDGAEDLKFFFGASDSKVAEAKKNFFNPLAFAYKETVGPTAWGHGIIWVAGDQKAKTTVGSDWSTSDLLQGILLHELGHMLGCIHMDETIMREDIVSFLKLSIQKSTRARKAMMSTIDWGEILVSPIDASYSLTGTIPQGQFTGAPTPANGNFVEAIFKTFVDRLPQGNVTAEFVQDPKTHSRHLLIKDDLEENDFAISNFSFGSWIEQAGACFKTYDGNNVYLFKPYGNIDYGTITARNKKIYNVIIQRGSADTVLPNQNPGLVRVPLVVKYLDNGHPIDLFVAYPGGIPLNAK